MENVVRWTSANLSYCRSWGAKQRTRNNNFLHRKMLTQAIHAREAIPLGPKTLGTGRFIRLSLSVWRLPRASKDKLPIWSWRDVTLKRCQGLLKNRGYRVAADNYFSSLDLAAELSKRGLGFVGTLRSNRLKDCRVKSESDLKKDGRGAFDYAVGSSRNISVH